MPNVGIIDQFLHPPIGLMTREAIPGGPFANFTGFTRPSGPIAVDAFGIAYRLAFAPAGYGHVTTIGGELFDRVVCQLKVAHTLLDGISVFDQVAPFKLDNGFITFDSSFPAIVLAELSPGVTANFWWLLAL